MVLILPRGAIYLYVCISIVDACSFLAACSRTHSHTGFCPRCPSICGRTDYQYHVAPADMLRLGLAVCLPLTVTFLVSFVKKQSTEADRIRAEPTSWSVRACLKYDVCTIPVSLKGTVETGSKVCPVTGCVGCHIYIVVFLI